ncbi:LOW QUALITY PROTEIN: uncharacterized protein LOC105832213 [Monomorium pharaonis]|uniref:LOW QUALITY PROTEIN: uncharacterized protein LOC105832213 n=1 Tax=Monomorium pharaonis TaxID=307658 RepID=UPI00174771DF|nr:LOW QUALITY PROTEIN: uncharacterized protein LOC105832213 [Monomorium pharaonis]
MLCLKKRRTYSFTLDACAAIPRRSKRDNNHYKRSLNTAITTLPRKNSNREKRPFNMVLTVTEDTPVDMLTGSMELLVQLPRNHNFHTQRITVLRSTPMMDLLVQIATAHKLTASSYTLQAIGERDLLLPHHPNTPIGALDALQVKLLPKQEICVPRKTNQTNQPFETTFRLQVHLPRNQLYVSRVSPKMNLGEILDEVCREKNLDKSKYELRHPVNLEETLDLSLSLQDYHLQEVTLYAKQVRSMGPTLSTQDIMVLQRQEERLRQQTKQSVLGFMFKKSKEGCLNMASLGTRSVSPTKSDETARSISSLQPPARPHRKRRPAPKPPVDLTQTAVQDISGDENKDKMMIINHSRNSSDSSGYHEASVLSDNPDSAARLLETLPRRSKAPDLSDAPRKLVQTSQSSKSLGNLAMPSETLSREISSTSLYFTGLRKKRAAPPPPTPRPISSAISAQALERIVNSEELLTSDMGPSKPSSNVDISSKASLDIVCQKINSNIGIDIQYTHQLDQDKPKSEATMCESARDIQQNCTAEVKPQTCFKLDSINSEHIKTHTIASVEAIAKVGQARSETVGEHVPLPKPRKIYVNRISTLKSSKASNSKVILPLASPRTLSMKRDNANISLYEYTNSEPIGEPCRSTSIDDMPSSLNEYSFATLESKDILKSKNKYTILNKNQISQQKDTSKITDDITTKDDELSSQNLCYEVTNNVDLQNSNLKETHSKSKDKFNQKKKLQAIINNVKNHESLNLNLHLSNEYHIALNSTEFNVCSPKLLLSECNVVSKESRNNYSKQNYKMKSKYIDLCDENKNQCDNLWILDDNSSSESVMKLEFKKTKSVCMTEERQKLKGEQFCYRFTHQGLINAQKETIFSIETGTEEKVQAVNPEKGKESCTVISTIPKCEHLDAIRENGALNNVAKHYVIVEDIDELCEKVSNNTREELSGAKSAKRTRLIRSQSKSHDFEIDTLKKQKRYFTLPSEDIVHAVNLKLPTRNLFSTITEKSPEQVATGRCTDRGGNADVNKEESSSEVITACQDIPSETDILLQKVSDTLSNVLPTLPCTPASKPSLPLEINYTTTSMWTNNIIAVPNNCSVNQLETKADKSSELYKSCKDLSIENVLSANMSNITAANSLQDNYVSAMGDENMSIGDWEYQLPAPPSAFRDSHSPTFNTYDTVTLGSVEAFKEVASASPVAELDDAIDSSDKNPKLAKDLLNDVKMNCDQRPSSEKINLNIKRQTNKSIVKQMPAVSQQLETDSDLRKEVISELENKIETGVLVQTVNKDFDRRNMNNLSAPELAPMDNTLSNFTITTYTKQKSLFEEFEEPSDCTRNSDQRFTKTFATLSRNNASAHNYDQSNVMKSTHLINNLSRNKRTINKSEELNTNNIDCKMESKINDQGELSYKWRPINTINKNNIQRSKSYISSSKYQKEVQDINTRKHESQMKSEITGIKKATSITDLNVYSQKDNEKSSQWRNILRKEEELTKENQLQSLQVLKSILPQLKNTQQAKENVSAKDCNNALLNQRTKYKADSHKHSIRMSSISTHESCDKSECKRSQREESAKRYVYTSPPAISLGIWSERPSINVQIKTDSDCKQEKTTINSKTIVNINEMKKERGNVNYINRVSKNNIIRHKLNIDSLANKNSDELIAKKLIAHTAASNFKISNRFNAVSSYLTRNEDRAIVTGVQLKRTSTKAPREMLKSNENEVDTTPINFKELTKTFSQYPNFKQNPKYSDGSSAIPGDVQSNEMKKITNSSVKDNNHGWFTRATDQDKFSSKSQVQQNLRVRRFMSVDVNRTNCNLGLQDKIPFRCNVNNAVKINLPMPVVKGFKIPTSDLKTNNNEVNDNGLSTIDDFNKQSPKPPTMPVITGVTLKNTKTKPKSIPLVQLNPRDMLLESIRNFGGREKLKSISERY